VTSDGYDQSWITVQRGHAVANACYLAAVNRAGFEPETGSDNGIEFWGQSFVADPWGKVVAQAGAGEEIVLASIDLDLVHHIRSSWSYPFRDRRVDSYGDLTKLYLD
jgi:N-carbamoylputrescine amidase